MLLWRPWWHHAAVGPRVLVVHAVGALGFNSVRTHGVARGLGEDLVERNGAGGLAVGRDLRPWGRALGEGLAERLGVGEPVGDRDLAPGGETLARSTEVRRPDSSRSSEVRGPGCASGLSRRGPEASVRKVCRLLDGRKVAELKERRKVRGPYSSGSAKVRRPGCARASAASTERSGDPTRQEVLRSET